MVPRGWYTLEELWRGTIEWESLTVNFTQTFEFASEHPTVDATLQVRREKIFAEITVVDTHPHQCNITMHNYVVWYKIMIDPTDNDPVTIISMCQKECAKWKEITCVKIHGTLLDRIKKNEKRKIKSQAVWQQERRTPVKKHKNQLKLYYHKSLPWLAR